MRARSFCAMSALVLLSLAGCKSSSTSEQDLANLPTPKSATEAAQRVVAYAAGYCKGMVEKHGADFETCFKQQTDLAMAKIEGDAVSKADQAEQPK